MKQRNKYVERAIEHFEEALRARNAPRGLLDNMIQNSCQNILDHDVDPSILQISWRKRNISVFLRGLPAEEVSDEKRCGFQFVPYKNWEETEVVGIGLFLNWNKADLAKATEAIEAWLLERVSYIVFLKRFGR